MQLGIKRKEGWGGFGPSSGSICPCYTIRLATPLSCDQFLLI